MKGIAGIWNALRDSFRREVPIASAPEKKGNRHYTTPPWESNNQLPDRTRLYDELNARDERPHRLETEVSGGFGSGRLQFC